MLRFGLENLLIHDNYKELDFLINKVFDEYQLIFSPLIEGGHQDHDTIAYSVVRYAIKRKSKKVCFYSTYSAFGNFGLFNVMTESKYSKGIFHKQNRKYEHCPIKSLRHKFGVYRSQTKSWFLVLLPYLFNVIFQNSVSIFKLNYDLFEYKKAIYPLISGKPLYEIHKRCNKSSWLSSLID